MCWWRTAPTAVSEASVIKGMVEEGSGSVNKNVLVIAALMEMNRCRSLGKRKLTLTPRNRSVSGCNYFCAFGNKTPTEVNHADKKP